MDQIESQASELDSFLAGSSTVVNVAPVGLLGSMAGASSGPARGGRDARGAGGSASSAGSLRGGLAHDAPSHSRHSGGVGSGQARTTSITTAPYSALGPGSAPHHSPTTATPTSTTAYHHPHRQASHIQHAANNHVINRSQALSASPGAVDAASAYGSGSVSAGAKRRAEASAEDAAQKQQRGKRTRVRIPTYLSATAPVSRPLDYMLTGYPMQTVYFHRLVCLPPYGVPRSPSPPRPSSTA